MDFRELFADAEEAYRTMLDGLRKHIWTAMPGVVSKNSDGHTSEIQPAIKGQVTDSQGNLSQVSLPILGTLPVLFAGGGSMVTTHPIKQNDEGLILWGARPIDSWHQSGGVQNPIDTRIHSLSDAFWIPGLRSTPNKLKNYSGDSHQTRSLDGKVTTDHHPTNGITAKVVDPSDSASNPFASAAKFVQTLHTAAGAIQHQAVSSGATHESSTDHSGARIMAANAAHKFEAALSGLAAQTAAAFNINAASGTNLTGGLNADTGHFSGGLSVGSGGGGGGNPVTGVLGGDVTGPEASTQVVGITHVANANTLPVCASDSAAASAGVIVGGLYLNNTINASFHVLCVRWS